MTIVELGRLTFHRNWWRCERQNALNSLKRIRVLGHYLTLFMFTLVREIVWHKSFQRKFRSKFIGNFLNLKVKAFWLWKIEPTTDRPKCMHIWLGTNWKDFLNNPATWKKFMNSAYRFSPNATEPSSRIIVEAYYPTLNYLPFKRRLNEVILEGTWGCR